MNEKPRGFFVFGLILGVVLGYLLAFDSAKISLWNIRVAMREDDVAAREREQRCTATLPVILQPRSSLSTRGRDSSLPSPR
jgi:hypothetical protein